MEGRFGILCDANRVEEEVLFSTLSFENYAGAY